MMAHNLCYSTLTNAAGVQQYNLQPDQYIRTPTNGTALNVDIFTASRCFG